MSSGSVKKVLITGGHEVGGVESFARSLRSGFNRLGIETEIISPFQILLHWHDLRDRSVLKILSTHALFAAILSRRTICVSHGFPRPDAQGWPTTIVKIVLYKIANMLSECKMVIVSHYCAVHLRCISIYADAVIHNAIQDAFFLPLPEKNVRNYITYVGRLVPAKNVHKILPAMIRVINDNQQLRIRIVGDGSQRKALEKIARDNSRIEFVGNKHTDAVIQYLRDTRVLISGNEMEPFGITYTEALSQGCSVVMPACGGGLEICLDEVGRSVQLFSLSYDQDSIVSAINKALHVNPEIIDLSSYRSDYVAAQYLRVAQE